MPCACCKRALLATRLLERAWGMLLPLLLVLRFQKVLKI